MSNLINLAHIQINGGDTITVQLLRVEDLPPAVRTAQQAGVRIMWPPQPTVVDAREFPQVAAQLTQLFATASIELARIKARKRPPL